ncbi:hypothetical protein [Streptomyces sp. NBC_01614]|uniref:hypothetical protein n=1 Tax=Streptomyces sp. NBC_01614 TaxID=2975897 RepID=UPI00386A207C
MAGDGHAAGEGRALLEQELSDVFRGRMSGRDRARVEKFRTRRIRQVGAVEGMAAVVAALQRAQAGALLLNTPVDLPLRLWAGSEPTQIALSAAGLESFGVLGCQEEPSGAALIRALVRTGAELASYRGRNCLWRTGWACCCGTPTRACRCDSRGPAGAGTAGSTRCREELVRHV